MSTLESRRVGREVDERSDDTSTISRHKDESHREDSLVRRTEVVSAPGYRVWYTGADGADAQDEGEVGDCGLFDWIDYAENDESAVRLLVSASMIRASLSVPDAGERHPENVEFPSISDSVGVKGGEDRDYEGEGERRSGEKLSLRSGEGSERSDDSRSE